MKKFLALFVFLASFGWAQVPVSPVINPHVTFVDAAGAPCASCNLYSYIAGTTTPQATYVDSTGTSQNTNPIVLDPSGGAQIWFGRLSYKLVLKTAAGVTLWTVDNVSATNGFPCSTPTAIQIANAGANGFTCDATITINATAHTLNVGTLPTNHVTIGPLGTATSWTFDTTSPATACTSIGCSAVGSGTAGQLAYYASSGTALSGTSAIPNGITATTQAASDNSTKVATTAYVAAPGVIAPSSVAVNGGTAMTDNQGNGSKVQHATGATVTNDILVYDANGNAVDSGVQNVGSNACTAYTSTATAGCTIMADGKWMEWATGSPCTADCTQTVGFPVTFPTACYSVTTANSNVSATNIVKMWGINSACTTTGVLLELQRRGDEGSFTATPIVWAIGK